jgi:3-phosphoshikimate 1-carboxyvinyltransferase
MLESMSATVTCAKDSITVTREPGTKLRGVNVDCDKIPNVPMTLTTIALFTEGPMTIRNVYQWRLRETEWMKAIVAKCTTLGVTVKEFSDYCVSH